MFEKLITDLKNSLPAPIRKKLGIAENSEESEVEDSDYNEESEDSASSSPEASAEEQKKKRNSMIVRVVVILALAYFAVDEFVLKPNQVSEEAPVTDPRKNRPKKKVAATENAAATPANETAANPDATAATTTTAADPSAQPVQNSQGSETSTNSELSAYEPAGTGTETAAGSAETATPPIENVNILSKTETPDQKIDQLLNEVDTSADSSASSSSSSSSSSTTSETTSGSPSVGETTTAQDSFTPTVDNSMEIPTELPAEQITIPSQPKKSQESSSGNSMASKIAEDAVETPPPAYDQVGRGLVYNCKDKYWACLNKTAYVVCNKNMKWNKSKGESAECVVQNIYSSDEDCAKVQKYNVSTNVATSFCQN